MKNSNEMIEFKSKRENVLTNTGHILDECKLFTKWPAKREPAA